jgi:hypothetical protein
LIRTPPPPRLYAIVATNAARAVVFRKAAGWWCLYGWDLESGALTEGAWFRGTLYPRRADLSPDGTLLYYFALKGTATYHAISKAPWLRALALWRDSGTWTRGHHFVSGTKPPRWDIGKPHDGTAEPVRERGLGLARTEPSQYASERRRGWIEHPLSPPRAEGDMWDEQRSAILVKGQPRGKQALVLNDTGWDGRAADRIEGRRPDYRLERGAEVSELPEAMWADWDHRGRLLVATDDGRLQIRDTRGDIIVDHDVRTVPVRRAPAPAWARTW